MKRFGVKQIIPLCGILFSLPFIYVGLTKLGFWESQGPLPGFFPVIMSTVFFFVSILALLQSFKEKSWNFPKEDLLIIVAVAVAILAHFVIGLVASMLLFVALWLRFVEKTPWLTIVKILVIIAAIVLGVFQFWLKVQFPLGILGDMIVGLL